MVLKANLRKRKENLENHNDLILHSERWIRWLKKRGGVRKSAKRSDGKFFLISG